MKLSNGEHVLVEEQQMGSKKKSRTGERGFTLIEMLAVVVILVIVAGIGFIVVNRQIEASRERTDITNFRTLADAATHFMMDHPNYTGTAIPWDNTGLLSPDYMGQPLNDPWDSVQNGADYDIAVTANARNITIRGHHPYTTIPQNNVGVTPNGTLAQLVINY